MRNAYKLEQGTPSKNKTLKNVKEIVATSIWRFWEATWVLGGHMNNR